VEHEINIITGKVASAHVHVFVTCGYLAVSSGNITNEVIRQYIQEREGEIIVDDSRFQIDTVKPFDS